MTKYRKRSRRNKKHYRKKRGGTSTIPTSSYSSGSTFGTAINGSSDSQYTRVFGPNSPYPPNGNAIIGVQGQRAGSRKRKSNKKSCKKSYKGGFMGGIVDAIVPASLIGLQRYFTKKFKK